MGLVPGFLQLAREEVILRGFYSGFIPLVYKQVPFAVGQLSVHEVTVEVIY